MLADHTMEAPKASKRTFQTRLLNFVLTVVVGYLLVLVIIRIFEARLIFFPDYPDRLEGDWHPRGLPVEDVWLTAPDGIKLHAWWIPNAKAKFTFLAFHGNASNIANRAQIYEFLHNAPGNVLAVEYRGYGRSEGHPSEAGIYRDAGAGYEYLVQAKGTDPRTIVSFGQSLGTAVATHLAAHRPVAGLVLEAPFPSASRVAREVYWFLPGVGLAVSGQFNTGQWIKEVRAPVLIVHCKQDPVIPFGFGQEVYEAALQPKTFVAIENSCHEDASLMSPKKYGAVLKSFVDSLR